MTDRTTGDDVIVTRRGFSSRGLVKAIFDAPAPEDFARSVPAQSLYLAIRHAGLMSSSDLLMLTTIEQTRLLLDFDCWSRDSFNEEHFWEWLALGDDEDGLRLLQKLVQSIDLKLIGLMISRYVEVQIFQEPNETPPQEGYYTPDKGYTWLLLKIEDATKLFLFGRLLAMLFETNADLFYQLLSTPGVATESMLEEDSYTERNKRLASEGIPEPEVAAEVHAPLPSVEIKALLADSPHLITVRDIGIVEPFIYDSSTPEPLAGLLRTPRYRDDLEAEITFLMNAAIVHFCIDTSNHLAVLQLTERVKGAINLGLESAARLSGRTPSEVYEHLGIRSPYRHAHSLLMSLRSHVGGVRKSIPDADLTLAEREGCAALHSRFPFALRFMCSTPASLRESEREKPDDSAAQNSGTLDTSADLISSLAMLEMMEGWVRALKARHATPGQRTDAS